MGSERRLRAVSALLALSLSMSVVGVSGVAFAAPTQAEKDEARTAMQEGRDKRDANDLQGALTAFQKAHKIMNVPSTGIEVAKTLVALGQLREAFDVANSVTHLPANPNEPAPFAQARVDAQKMVDDLTRKIPAVTLKINGLPDVDTATVTVDGQPITGDARLAPIHVNPGEHTFSVKASDGREQKQKLTLKEGDTKDVPLDFGAGNKPGPITTKVNDDEPKPQGGGKSRFLRPIPIAGYAITGVGLIAGGVTGVIALSKASSAKSACNGNLCPPSTHSDIKSGRNMATISNVGFIVAGVGAIVAVVGIAIAPKQEAAPAPAEPASGLRVNPWIGVGSIGATGTF